MIVASIIGDLANAVFSAAGQWVADGASWILNGLVAVVSATTTPPIDSAWFTHRLEVMGSIAAALAVPLVCCAAIQAVVRQAPGMLVRTVVVHLPVALTCTATAVGLVQAGLAVTDALSSQLLSAEDTSAGGALSPISAAFGAASGAPSFALLLGAVVVAVAGLALWLEMAVRSAAVSVAVLFLPLVMAALLWPAIGHWCRRLAETLAALVLSKLVVVGALGLAVAALGHGLTGASGGGGFGAVVTGAALLVVAAYCPFTLLQLIPAVEAGAVAQLEAARAQLRRSVGAPRRVANEARSWLPGGMGDGGLGPVGPMTEPGLDDDPGGDRPSGPGDGSGGGGSSGPSAADSPTGGGSGGAGFGSGGAGGTGGATGGEASATSAGEGRRTTSSAGRSWPVDTVSGDDPSGDDPSGDGWPSGGDPTSGLPNDGGPRVEGTGSGASTGDGAGGAEVGADGWVADAAGGGTTIGTEEPTPGAGLDLAQVPHDQLRATVLEAMTAGVRARYLDAAVRRRLAGLSADRAYEPYLSAAGPGSGPPAPTTGSAPHGAGDRRS